MSTTIAEIIAAVEKAGTEEKALEAFSMHRDGQTIVVVAEDERDARMALADINARDTEIETVDPDTELSAFSKIMIAEELHGIGNPETIGILVDLHGTGRLAQIENTVMKWFSCEGKTSYIRRFEGEPGRNGLEKNKNFCAAVLGAQIRSSSYEFWEWLPQRYRTAGLVEEVLSEYDPRLDHCIFEDLDANPASAIVEELCRNNEESLSRIAEWVVTLDKAVGAENPSSVDYVFPRLEDGMREALEDGIAAQDFSTPLDLLTGEVHVNWVPGSYDPESGKTIPVEDLEVGCDDISGNYARVIPDDNLARWFWTLNISAQEWKDFVASRAAALDEQESIGGQFWRDFEQRKRVPGEPPVLALDMVAEIINNTNGYGTPTISLHTSLDELVSIRPGDRIRVDGGVIGLHDYVNGSGALENENTSIELVYWPQEWHIDGDLGHGVDDVYGFTGAATSARVEWLDEQAANHDYARAVADALNEAMANEQLLTTDSEGLSRINREELEDLIKTGKLNKEQSSVHCTPEKGLDLQYFWARRSGSVSVVELVSEVERALDTPVADKLDWLTPAEQRLLHVGEEAEPPGPAP